MTKIKGTQAAVTEVAAIRDEEAGKPAPYSIRINGELRNVCPRDHSPLPAPVGLVYTCPRCGWSNTDPDATVGARRQMSLRCADVVESEKDVFVTEVSEDFAAEIKAAKEKPSKDKTEKGKKLSKVEVESISDTKTSKEIKNEIK